MLDFGVPPGFLLGPLLFFICINDLPKCLMHSEISMYPDDTVIYYSGSHVNAIREKLQEDLKRVEQCLTSNRHIKSEQNKRATLQNKATVANLIRQNTADPREGHRESDKV